jgi:hypothetical protein
MENGPVARVNRKTKKQRPCKCNWATESRLNRLVLANLQFVPAPRVRAGLPHVRAPR